jgi:hypothetical protein
VPKGETRKFAWLARFEALEYFSYDGELKQFDARWLPSGQNLRVVHVEEIAHPEALSRLVGLRSLRINGGSEVRDLQAIKELTMRRLEFGHGDIEDLRGLSDLRAIESVSAQVMRLRLLPQKTIPTLKHLDILTNPVEDEEIEGFRKANPQCDLVHDHTEALQRELAGVDGLRVRPGGVFERHLGINEALFESTDPELVRSVASMIRVDDIRGFVTCLCDAGTSIEFYRGEELAATLGVLGGSSLQTELSSGDLELTSSSRESLSRWLSEHGVPKLATSLAEHLEYKAKPTRRKEAIRSIIPRAAIESVEKAGSRRELAEAIRTSVTTDLERATLYLSLFGCDLSPWQISDYTDQVLEVYLLPKVSIESLTQVDLKPGEPATNGLARWLIGEGLWKEWPAAQLEQVMEAVGREGLTHPLGTNRRQTLMALGEMATPAARALLRSVLRHELTVRALPKVDEEDKGGWTGFPGESIAVPLDCPDHVHAAIWLARFKDTETKREISKLADRLTGENRTALKKAISGK